MLLKSDRTMRVVKDLFGDDPKVKNVTTGVLWYVQGLIFDP